MFFELNTVTIGFLVLIGLIAIFIAVFFYYYKRHVYHSKHVVPRVGTWVFLEIQMPKDNAKENEDQRPKTEEEKKLMIAVGEQLFTTLSESGHHKGWFKGYDYYSF